MNLTVLILYLLAYALIIFRPKTASITTLLLGITSLIVLNSFDFGKIGEIVDINTLSILLGMMLIVSILKERGVFTEVSEYIIKVSKGNFVLMLSLIYIAIFFLSAFLDNVTTILIFIPILFYISDVLNLDAKPITTTAIFFSNIGGMTTAIGDPPNIVIYSASKIPFLTFMTKLMPPGIIVLIFSMFTAISSLKITTKFEDFEQVRKETSAYSKIWLVYSGLFALVVFLMAIHDKLNMELGVITLLFSLSLLFLEDSDLHSKIEEVDWDTLFLVAGLYILNWAVEQLTFFDKTVNFFIPFQNSPILPILIFWTSLLFSGFIGALPVTLIIINIVKRIPSFNNESLLYLSLALGVGIGGNLTPVASMCNIVGNNLLKRLKNDQLNFLSFTKMMLKSVIFSGIIANVFIILWWFF